MKLGEPDSSGRRRPIPIQGSEHELDFDTVIMAVSQSPELEYLDEKSSFKLTKWNTFEVNPETLETNVAGIFAGGDVVHGPDTVITATGDGKRTAEVTRFPSQNGDGPLVIRCEDTLAKKFKEIPVDMVVLCNAIEPQPDSEKIRRLFSVSSSPDGFFLEKHPKLDPTSTATDGVYVAGCRLCKGCGTCVASCPSSAAKAQHFSDQQIFAEIEGILK